MPKGRRAVGTRGSGRSRDRRLDGVLPVRTQAVQLREVRLRPDRTAGDILPDRLVGFGDGLAVGRWWLGSGHGSRLGVPTDNVGQIVGDLGHVTPTQLM